MMGNLIVWGSFVEIINSLCVYIFHTSQNAQLYHQYKYIIPQLVSSQFQQGCLGRQ